jgi:hypothetical protein
LHDSISRKKSSTSKRPRNLDRIGSFFPKVLDIYYNGRCRIQSDYNLDCCYNDADAVEDIGGDDVDCSY